LWGKMKTAENRRNIKFKQVIKRRKRNSFTNKMGKGIESGRQDGGACRTQDKEQGPMGRGEVDLQGDGFVRDNLRGLERVSGSGGTRGGRKGRSRRRVVGGGRLSGGEKTKGVLEAGLERGTI